MCSTPKGSGLTTSVRRIKEQQHDARAYTDMLGRAARRYEERQREREERDADPGERRPD
jgi:hypothetical protein